MLYASPTWWGFTSAGNRAYLERLMGRMKRRGYLHPDDSFAHKADDVLMNAIQRNEMDVLVTYSILPCRQNAVCYKIEWKWMLLSIISLLSKYFYIAYKVYSSCCLYQVGQSCLGHILYWLNKRIHIRMESFKTRHLISFNESFVLLGDKGICRLIAILWHERVARWKNWKKSKILFSLKMVAVCYRFWLRATKKMNIWSTWQQAIRDFCSFLLMHSSFLRGQYSIFIY